MKVTDFPGFDELPFIVQKALLFAERKHEGQVRKDGSTPYITHPMGVLQILLDSPWHFTDDELAAAVLHDLLEDTQTTFKEIFNEFGVEVAGIVYLLTKPAEEHFRRKIYMSALRRVAPSVIAIKLADMLHNLRDLPKTAIIFENKVNPAQGIRREQEDFDEYFRRKVEEDHLPLIDVLRMHGPMWQNLANWFETHIRKELDR